MGKGNDKGIASTSRIEKQKFFSESKTGIDSECVLPP